MSDLTSKKNKHITFDDRLEIQQCLDLGMTFKWIAARIGKDWTTVPKEVKKHITVNPTEAVKHINLDGKPVSTLPCPWLLKAPFVCNHCKKRHARSSFKKQPYLAKNAHRDYILKSTKTGRTYNDFLDYVEEHNISS